MTHALAKTSFCEKWPRGWFLTIDPEDLHEGEETENGEEIRELPIYQHCRKISEEQFKVL